MRAKKATTPARSIRYLLYANRALQRISVRRLSVRQKKADKPSRSGEAKKNVVRVTSRSAKAAKASPVTEASSFFTADRPMVGCGRSRRHGGHSSAHWGKQLPSASRSLERNDGGRRRVARRCGAGATRRGEARGKGLPLQCADACDGHVDRKRPDDGTREVAGC